MTPQSARIMFSSETPSLPPLPRHAHKGRAMSSQTPGQGHMFLCMTQPVQMYTVALDPAPTLLFTVSLQLTTEARTMLGAHGDVNSLTGLNSGSQCLTEDNQVPVGYTQLLDTAVY